MKSVKVISIALITLSIICFVGCRMIDEPIPLNSMPTVKIPSEDAQLIVADQGDKMLENRFVDTAEQSSGAVESAIMWSQKYEELLAKNQDLTDKNRQFFLDNSDLRQKTEKLQAELDKTKAELQDANEFMQEMHGELAKWKADVLGFREEMRSAQTAQLQAMSKILTLLGAESTTVAANE